MRKIQMKKPPDDKNPTYEIFSKSPYFNGDEEITSFDLKTYTEEHEDTTYINCKWVFLCGMVHYEDFTSPVVTKKNRKKELPVGDLVFYAKLRLPDVNALGF